MNPSEFTQIQAMYPEMASTNDKPQTTELQCLNVYYKDDDGNPLCTYEGTMVKCGEIGSSSWYSCPECRRVHEVQWRF